jgi:hypothetical protein
MKSKRWEKLGEFDRSDVEARVAKSRRINDSRRRVAGKRVKS